MGEHCCNSRPLHWDKDGEVGVDVIWGIELADGADESVARRKLLEDVGEVDERFIHFLRSREGYRLMVVYRQETEGRGRPWLA